MAARLIDSLAGPAEDALERVASGPALRKLTSSKERKASRKKPRDLGVRVRKPDSISTYSPSAVQRVYDAVERVAPNLRPAVQGFENLTGARAVYEGGARGLKSLLDDSVYAGQSDLQQEDALNLGITGAAGPLLKGVGAVGRAAMPKGLADLAVRGKRYLTETSAIPEARPAYVRSQEGPFTNIERSDLAVEPVPEALETNSLAALRGMAQDRSRSPAIRAADEATMAVRGTLYDERAPLPVSSLQRQAGMGRAYAAAVEGSPDYKHAIFERYGETMPQVVEQAGAQNYDQLTEAAYRQLGDEVTQQFDTLPLRMRYHEGAGEYGSSTEMIQDALGRGQLNVFSGGDPHEFLNVVDPATGLNQNEMFRAVHDYTGHVVPGSRFGPSGEEIAYAAHAQQLSPLAQMALLSETRGQNSLVNYSPLNADLIRESNILRKRGKERQIAEGMLARGDNSAARYLDQLPSSEEIAQGLRDLGQQTQYAPQRAVLLPPEYLDPMSPGGTPEWLRPLLSRPDAVNNARGVQLSRVAGLETADPAFYGTGHRGVDYRRVSGDPSVPLRTHFYSGPKGTIEPEEQVMGLRGSEMREGPRYAYEADLNNLYDIDADPSGLSKLAQAYKLPQYKPVLSLQDRLASRQIGLEGLPAISDLERLVRDYGYSGYMADFDAFGGGRRAAAVYEPVSGLRPIERGPMGYAEGGYVSGNSE